MSEVLRAKAPSNQTLIQITGIRPARVHAAISSPVVSQPRSSCSSGRKGASGRCSPIECSPSSARAPPVNPEMRRRNFPSSSSGRPMTKSRRRLRSSFWNSSSSCGFQRLGSGSAKNATSLLEAGSFSDRTPISPPARPENSDLEKVPTGGRQNSPPARSGWAIFSASRVKSALSRRSASVRRRAWARNSNAGARTVSRAARRMEHPPEKMVSGAVEKVAVLTELPSQAEWSSSI